MRAIYITQFNFVSGRAHVRNVLKTCEEFGGQMELTLVTANHSATGKQEEIFRTHGLAPHFKFAVLNSSGNKMKGTDKVSIFFRLMFFNFSLMRFMLLRWREFEVLYYRDHLLLPAAIFGKYLLGKKLFFEAHYTLDDATDQKMVDVGVKTADGVIAITRALAEYYKPLNKNISVAYCAGAEENEFVGQTQDVLRQELALPADKIILGYAGTFARAIQGVYDLRPLVEALKFFPENFIFVGIGDRNDSAAALRQAAKEFGVENRAIFLPWTDQKKVFKYLAAFDILLAPSAGERPGDFAGKIFDYLMAAKPIIASVKGPTTEILQHQRDSLFVVGNSAKEWAEQIQNVRNDKGLAEKLSAGARETATRFTWRERGRKIFEFIKQNA
jgi:glycosyltransferase involved in cell wall biosynthesis